jgi:hypothetical protein
MCNTADYNEMIIVVSRLCRGELQMRYANFLGASAAPSPPLPCYLQIRQDNAAGTHQRTEIWLSTTFGCHLGCPFVHGVALSGWEGWNNAETEACHCC